MNKIVIYINAKDRVGIIADISKNITDLKGNIETNMIYMIILLFLLPLEFVG